MEWRPVPGYEGLYEVSDEGCVRSLPRLITHYTGKVLRRRGKALEGCFQEYHQVSLCKEGVTRTHHTHVLVAAAFLGPRPDGMVTRHRDGDRTDNAALNLCYGTPQENSDDMREHGTVLRGSAHGMAKLADPEVIRLRQLADTYTQGELAELFGISRAQAGNIVRNEQWRHI